MAFNEHMNLADALGMQGGHRFFGPYSPDGLPPVFGFNRQMIQIARLQ